MPTTKDWSIIALLLAFAALALVGTMDAQDADAQHAEYCSMVETWKGQSHLPPEQRDGWPPFKGECK